MIALDLLTGAACSSCGFVHVADDVSTVGRFESTPTQYRARFDGSPLRADRAQAEADMCQWRQRPRTAAPQQAVEPAPVRDTPSRPNVEAHPFPAAAMERLAREKAWLDFLTQATFSLTVWRLDRSLTEHVESPIEWLRSCARDLADLVARETADAA